MTPTTGYRPHLDGVRAIAVILVILFHLGFRQVPGGFVGVDVFFVMSGYLITGLLLGEVATQGTVRLRRFYARRVRRLLPASALVLVAVMVASIGLLDLVQRRSVGHDATASALYLANWHFGAASGDYFAEGQVPSPLVHFWSLAVEEQFYLVWPVLFLGLCRLGRRLAPRRADGTRGDGTTGLLVGILGLGAVSAVLSVALVPSTMAYYGTDTRAYQLLAGAALAVAARRLRPRLPSGALARRTGGGVALGALGSLLWLAHTIPDAGQYPGLAGLAVTAASLALIAGLDLVPAGPVQRVLGSAVPAGVGRLSYSLYLWHWPVIVFAPLLAAKWSAPALAHRPAQVALMAALAVTSYWVVERPIRFRFRPGAPSPVVIGLGLTMSIAIAVVAFPLLQPTRGFQEHVASAVTDLAQPGSCPYFDQDYIATKATSACVDRRGHGKTVALVGDSHAQQWLPALRVLADEDDLTLLRVTRGGCSANDITSYQFTETGQKQISTACTAWRHTSYRRLIDQYDPDMVIVATRSQVKSILLDGHNIPKGRPGHLQAWTDGWRWTIDTLGAGGAQVVVSDILPTLPERVPACLAEVGHRTDRCDFRVTQDPAVPAYNEAIDELPTTHPDVTVFDPTAIACPGGTCPGMMGDIVVHRDDNHLTASFVRSQADAVGALLRRSGAPL